MKRKNLRSPIKTKYPGVYYRLGMDSRGNAEKKIYVSYRREGRQIFEPVGVEGYMIGDPPVKLTLSVANDIRSARRRGVEPSNQERREAAAAERAAEDSRWTIGKLAKEYFEHRERQKTFHVDQSLYKRYLEDEFKEKTPEEIDPLSLDRFRKKLSLRKSSRNAEKTISPVSVRNGMALLRQIVNHGMERRLTKGFPVAFPFPVYPPVGRRKDLSPAQLAALLAALDAEKDQDRQMWYGSRSTPEPAGRNPQGEVVRRGPSSGAFVMFGIGRTAAIPASPLSPPAPGPSWRSGRRPGRGRSIQVFPGQAEKKGIPP
jgi:hypothetical protein